MVVLVVFARQLLTEHRDVVLPQRREEVVERAQNDAIGVYEDHLLERTRLGHAVLADASLEEAIVDDANSVEDRSETLGGEPREGAVGRQPDRQLGMLPERQRHVDRHLEVAPTSCRERQIAAGRQRRVTWHRL
ncbi:MAG: hypothetical protein OEN00_15750, partial [Gemmatimonadota bacterium]|nr:hypothetical protein [Gemmatimonadota bacterium]